MENIDNLQPIYSSAFKQGEEKGIELGFSSGFIHGVNDGRNIGFELGFITGASMAARDLNTNGESIAKNLLHLLKDVGTSTAAAAAAVAITTTTTTTSSKLPTKTTITVPNDAHMDRIRTLTKILESKLNLQFNKQGNQQQTIDGTNVNYDW
jgi:hypothetical protein